MLGFTKKTKLEAYKLHTSDAPVNINKVNVLEIRCNAVQGSYTVSYTHLDVYKRQCSDSVMVAT